MSSRSSRVESTKEVRERFKRAFGTYSAAQTTLLSLRAAEPVSGDSASIEGINAQLSAVAAAEQGYRAVRVEYIERLLSVPD